MTVRLTAALAPVAASVAGWMLSGSPVPMTLTVLLLLLALIGGTLAGRKSTGPLRSFLPPLLLAGGAFALELRWFSDGSALAVRAELPFAYHAGMALLWWASVDSFVEGESGKSFRRIASSFGGLAGGILLLGASAGTVLYDFGPWQVHPVSALPLALWASALLSPSTRFAGRLVYRAIPASLLLTALLLASTAAADRLRPVFFPVESTTLNETGAPAPRISGSGPTGDGATRRIPREADVRFRGQVLLQLKAHSPTLFRQWIRSPLYVRTSTLALFENEEVLSPIRSGRWRYDEDDGVEDHRVPLEGTGSSTIPGDSDSLHTLYITRDSVGHLPLLSGSSVLFADAVYEFADDWYQLAPAEGIHRLRYTALAEPGATQSSQRLPDAKDLRSGDAPAIYLSLPPSPIAARVKELTSTFPLGDPLGAIRRHLKENSSYSLRFKTPDDSSPIREFLFGSRTGHCEHYAAATVLMLRSLGIPSRVAYGYAGGAADTTQRLLAFRDSDFHAWAEILGTDGNWLIFDTTPVVPSAAPRMAASMTLPTVDETVYHDFSEFDPSTVARHAGLEVILADLVDFLSRHFTAVTAAGLTFLALLWRLLPGGRRTKRHAGGAPASDNPRHSRESPDYLREIERAAAALGTSRKTGETWREFLHRLGRDRVLPPEFAMAVSYHYHRVYAGGSPDKRLEHGLLRGIRDWNANLATD